MNEQGPFILSLIGNVLLSVVALLAFHVGRAAGRQEDGPAGRHLVRRESKATNVQSIECITCRTKTDAINGKPLHADSVDEFLHNHRGHGVRVFTVGAMRAVGLNSN